jgi:anti-sigma factor RsiW
MEHTEIRRTLSAYLDNAVSPEEQAEIEAHLAGCRTCRGALADLERTVAHLNGLPEVEPPPWLTARIMARVRDGAEHQPGFWRRLFQPFRVKLPIQALALVILCVTGYYLARTNTPLLQPTPPSPATREDALPAPVPPGPHQTPGTSARPKAPAPAQRAPSGTPGAASQRREEPPGHAPPPPAHGAAPSPPSATRAPAPSPPPQAAAPATAYPVPVPESGTGDEAIRARREA